MLGKLRKVLYIVLSVSAIYASAATGATWQKNMTFDNDESAWGVFTHLWGDGRVVDNENLARSGTKSGFVYSIRDGWTGLGRHVSIPLFVVYSDDPVCLAWIYAMGEPGHPTYFEVIDTDTWTYLILPVAHTPGSESYTLVYAGEWVPPRKNVYLRHVANAGQAGGFTYSYIDDATIYCQYD